jgi:hypothetical protein
MLQLPMPLPLGSIPLFHIRVLYTSEGQLLWNIEISASGESTDPISGEALLRAAFFIFSL